MYTPHGQLKSSIKRVHGTISILEDLVQLRGEEHGSKRFLTLSNFQRLPIVDA